MLTHQ
jgi:S-(hydroxymethyl)glutathione dehydrogenase / alcohol dehydrogenase